MTAIHKHPGILRAVDRIDRSVGMIEELFAKGDVPGHEFHDNQYGDGSGGTGEPSSDRSSPNYERLRDRIEGTQAEADRWVKKLTDELDKIIEKLKEYK